MLRKVPHRRWRGTGLKYTPKHTTREVRRGGQGREEAPLTQFAVVGRRDTQTPSAEWHLSPRHLHWSCFVSFLRVFFWFTSAPLILRALIAVWCCLRKSFVHVSFLFGSGENPSAVTQCAAGSALHQHSIIKVHASLTSFHLLYTTLCNVMTLSAISRRYTR